jgi:hypothetical protein
MRHRSALHGATILLAAWLSACATTPGDRSQATSGPVSWEVVDMTQVLRSDGLGIRWNYTLVLKEKKGTGIQFEKIETALVGPTVGAGEVSRQNAYRERLAANGELRLNLVSTFSFLNPSTVGSGRDIREFAYGLTAQRRFFGQDESGQAVRFDVKIPLDRGTGRRLTAPRIAPGPSPLPRVPVTNVATLAGEWQGHYRSTDGYDLPLRLTVRDDGTFEAVEGDPVRNRYRGTLSARDGQVGWSMRNGSGPLGLHDDGGKRVLAGRVPATSQGTQSFNYDLRLVESRPATVSPSPEAPRVATPAPTLAPPPVRGGASTAVAPATPALPGTAPTIVFRHPPDQGRVTDSATVVVADISSDRGLGTIGVSVNGARVYEQAESGAKAVPLNVPISLREGANVIVVSATEPGGGVRQEVRTVTYQLPAGIRVSYRVHGSAMNLNLKYRSPDGRTEQKKVLLPIDAAWELLFSARAGDTLEVTAQNAGEAGWVTCEIVVEGTAIAARTEEGREPTVTCKGIVTPPR